MSKMALPPVVVTAVLLAAAGQPVWAEDNAYCSGLGLSGGETPALAKVTAPDRTHFIEASLKNATCPDLSPACRSKGFVIQGDQVVIARTRGPVSCAIYMKGGDEKQAGWLPRASLTVETAAPVTPVDWAGHWTIPESNVVIATKPDGQLHIKGNATYGASDPDRVKRGAVNLGAFEATVTPDGAALAFTTDFEKTLPITGGDETDCRIWMRRLGPYLLVDDNNACGGMNVTFRGIYSRKP